MKQLIILHKERNILIHSAKRLLENALNCNRLRGQTHQQWTERINQRRNINVGDPMYETAEIMDCLNMLAEGPTTVYVWCTNAAIRDHVRRLNSQFIVEFGGNALIDASHTTILHQIKSRSCNLPLECFLGSEMHDNAIDRASHLIVYDTNALMTPNVVKGCFDMLKSREFIKLFFFANYSILFYSSLESAIGEIFHGCFIFVPACVVNELKCINEHGERQTKDITRRALETIDIMLGDSSMVAVGESRRDTTRLFATEGDDLLINVATEFRHKVIVMTGDKMLRLQCSIDRIKSLYPQSSLSDAIIAARAGEFKFFFVQ